MECSSSLGIDVPGVRHDAAVLLVCCEGLLVQSCRLENLP